MVGVVKGLQGVAASAGALLHVRPGEGRRTAILFTHLLLASCVFILGRTVRDTLFLSRYSLSALPWMFVLYGVASSITAALYAFFADRIPRHRMIVASVATGVASYLGVWALVRAHAGWIYPVFYVWSEVVANLFIVQFWTLANDLYDPRSAKRLFGLIGSARVLGVVLIGLSTGVVVRLLGTAQLLFVLAGLMTGIALLVMALRREPRADSGGVTSSRRPPPAVTKDPYVRALALFILLAFAALTVGDYQFKAIARATYREDDLAQFFALFYAATGIASFLFQVFLTPRLLGRFGVGLGMSVMPAVFGAASFVLPVWPHLAVASVMKFADNGFQYTIHDTTLQALYVPFAARVKARTRAVLEAAIKPCSYGIGGLILVVAAPRLPVAWLSAITVALVAAWLVAIRLVRARYLRTLQATLTATGSLDLDGDFVLDAGSRSALLAVAERGRPREVLAAIERLAVDSSEGVTGTLERLAVHADARVRVAALEALEHRADGSVAVARAALSDGEPAVRAAAARTLAALAGDEGVDDLATRAEDPERPVRIAAVVGLLQHGGVDGELIGGARLARMLGSEAKRDRREAARVLGHLGPGAYRPLRRLLHDEAPSVRRRALKACAGVPDPRLVPELIGLLDDRGCRRRAGRALGAIGAPAVPALIDLLGRPETPRPVALLVPRILRETPSPDTYARLRGCTDVVDSEVRARVYGSLSRIREAVGGRPEPVEAIAVLVQQETSRAVVRLDAWRRALPRWETPLLLEQVDLRHRWAIQRVLRVLEMRYDRRVLHLVRDRVNQPARRANALEMLDAVLDAALRPPVMRFVESTASFGERPAEGDPPPGVPDPEALVRDECCHANPYIALVTLDALAQHRDPLAAELGLAALEHPDPLVREGGVHALAAVAPGVALERLPALLEDPDPAVARHARARLDALRGVPGQEVPVPSTVEKILFLKTAAVFERVSGEDLAALARVAVEERYRAGERIFSEGDMGDALFVIVGGSVAITRGGEPVATLGAGEAFGEMSVLDAAPRSATATAAEETDVLRIGSEEFYETLHEQTEIAEGVIRMLTRRLRATGDPAARSTVISS